MNIFIFVFCFLTNRRRGEKDKVFNIFGMGSGEVGSDLTAERMPQESNVFKFEFMDEGKDKVRVFF